MTGTLESELSGYAFSPLREGDFPLCGGSGDSLTRVLAVALAQNSRRLTVSSVVNGLHRCSSRPRGLFASGKFDQYKRNMPYATLAQAFQTLVRQVLVKGESVKTMPSGRSNAVECWVGASAA